ncbi:DUF418 domain-containing protein [Niabella insulamsoli]|uniref:DUF418 domain-containing protein n=1 Tax=Niabella insulamsoli TaxID=3144874 RepID=UPI0031FBF131
MRALSLIAITFRHFLTRYNYDSFEYAADGLVVRMDRLVEFADFHLFYGKAYAIFAFLFGYSLFLQQKSKGSGFQKYMAARLFLLLVFACFNSIFFPSGDILLLYAIVGLLILPVIRVRSRWLLFIALFFLLQPIEWIAMVTDLMTKGNPLSVVSSGALKHDLDTALKSVSVGEAIWLNLTKGQLSAFIWSLESGRLAQTIGLMLLGFYVGKKGFLLRLIAEGRAALRYLYIPLFIGIFCFSISHLMVGDSYQAQKLDIILSNWINLCVAALYVMIFVSFYEKTIAMYTAHLNAYGRMSLSNYLFQSLVGGILFAPFGFDLGDTLSSTYLVVVCFTMIVYQVIFSNIWLQQRNYGPAEYIWRRATSIFFQIKSGNRPIPDYNIKNI